MKLHRIRLIAAAIVVTAGFVIAGCGSSGSSGGASSQSTSTPAPASTGSESTSTPAETSTASTGTTTIKVSADPGGQLAFVEKTLTAPVGKSTIEFTNASPVPHNIAVEANGKNLGPTEDISNGGKTTLSIDLPAGTYEFYCAVPGHREAGMKGVLTVK